MPSDANKQYLSDSPETQEAADDGNVAAIPDAHITGNGSVADVLDGSVPPDTAEVTEPDSTVQAEQKTEPLSWIRRTLARCGPVRRWSEYRMYERVAWDLTFWRDRDPKENARSRLPENENIELPVIWVAELYTPSTVSGLLTGISDLGWEYGKTRDDSLAKWMSDVRRGRRAGWTSLGLVSPAESPHMMSERTAALPEGVKGAMPVLISVTPSITALIVAFLMSDESAKSLNVPLCASYSTRMKRDPRFRRWHVIPHVLWNRPIHTSRSIFSPDLIRRNEVRASLQDLERRCTTWVGEKMPGTFASGLPSKKIPTAMLFVTETISPLGPASRGVWAFQGLSIDRDYDAWESDEWPGGRLALPRLWDDEAPRLVFGCRRSDAFPERAGYVDPTSNWTIAQRADDHVRGLLVRWALSCMLDGYHESFSILRDKSAARRFYRPIRDLKALRSLARAQLNDALTSASEIAEFVEWDSAYRYATLEMKHVRDVDGERPDLLEHLKSSQATSVRQLEREAALLQSTLAVSTEVTQTISNIRTGRLVVSLTIVSVAIALAAIFITLSSSW